MNKTNERIKKAIRKGSDDQKIAKILGRPLTDDLQERIKKLK